MADLLEFVIHEKQEGNLCAQHALNALLQGSYFTAVDLSEIARDLDAREMDALSQSAAARQRHESSNYDDSGFFSVQVISEALKVWNLEIVPWAAPAAEVVRDQPASGEADAFICNLLEHWFTLRRFGHSPQRWYNMNSLYSTPEYVSETFLSVLLAQLQNEGYSIFIVAGSSLPRNPADEYALNHPIPSPESINLARNMKVAQPSTSSSSTGADFLRVNGIGVGGDGDDDLSRALAMSLQESGGGGSWGGPSQQFQDDPIQQALKQSLMDADADDKTLQQALLASTKDVAKGTWTDGAEDEMLQAALAESGGGYGIKRDDSTDELERAIELSLQQQSTSSGVESVSAAQPQVLSVEEMRRKRLEKLGGGS
ncbi:Josephin-domain-containing protein [Cladochytrium replicatum]|nr:Josephin-domain-containing protein [Cladochytrium replicatum]